MTNIENLLSISKLSHSKLSEGTGRKGNWYNDAFNNNEDIHISSLAKLLSVVDSKHGITNRNISEIFDEKVLRLSSLMSRMSDENETDTSNLISLEIVLFTDLIGDWGSLEAKKKLTSDEKEVFHSVRLLVLRLTKGEK
jgi:hypothetical protein